MSFTFRTCSSKNRASVCITFCVYEENDALVTIFAQAFVFNLVPIHIHWHPDQSSVYNVYFCQKRGSVFNIVRTEKRRAFEIMPNCSSNQLEIK